jgi:hypothetical protein
VLLKVADEVAAATEERMGPPVPVAAPVGTEAVT